MNDRIGQLILQAGTDASGKWISLDQARVLAQLIVEEMLQTCEDHPAWTGRMIGEQIKQHFGVKE